MSRRRGPRRKPSCALMAEPVRMLNLLLDESMRYPWRSKKIRAAIGVALHKMSPEQRRICKEILEHRVEVPIARRLLRNHHLNNGIDTIDH